MNAGQETEPNEYNEYMPPPNQASSVFHVDSGPAVMKPEADLQYEDFGGSPAEYAQMYSTPIKPTKKNQKKKKKQNVRTLQDFVDYEVLNLYQLSKIPYTSLFIYNIFVLLFSSITFELISAL